MYPTFAVFLQERYRDGTRKPVDDARAFKVQEQTILGWCSGGTPNHRLRSKIEQVTGYQFVERRYAEVVAAMQFPPADAHPALRALTSYAQFHAFLRALATRVPQAGIADAAAGMRPSTLHNFLGDPSLVPDHAVLTKVLRALPALIEECLGRTLTARTPRAVLGRYLHDCRQQRGVSQADYAERIGIHAKTYHWIEAAGSASARAAGNQRAPFQQNAELTERIVRFLEQERATLGVEVPVDDAWLYLGAAPVAVPPVQSSEPALVPARSTPILVTAVSVRARLCAFIEMTGSQKGAARRLGLRWEHVRDFLRDGAKTGATIERMSHALDRVGLDGHPQPHAAVPHASGATPAAGARAPDDVGARVQALEAQLSDLQSVVARLTGGTPTDPISGGAARYVSPISQERFAPHHGVVTPAELDAIRDRIRAVCEDLGHLAALADDARRSEIQRVLGPSVDELFVTIEGFGREFPIAALDTLASQRRFADEYHERIAHGDPASPTTRRQE